MCIRDSVETEPEIQDKEGAIDLENVKGDVCYDNVSFHYSDDNKTVLSQVSIHIPAGKSVALVGPSGGGKTTICSLLPRFYDVWFLENTSAVSPRLESHPWASFIFHSPVPPFIF